MWYAVYYMQSGKWCSPAVGCMLSIPIWIGHGGKLTANQPPTKHKQSKHNCHCPILERRQRTRQIQTYAELEVVTPSLNRHTSRGTSPSPTSNPHEKQRTEEASMTHSKRERRDTSKVLYISSPSPPGRESGDLLYLYPLHPEYDGG